MLGATFLLSLGWSGKASEEVAVEVIRTVHAKDKDALGRENSKCKVVLTSTEG